MEGTTAATVSATDRGPSGPSTEPTRRQLSARQAETVQRLTAATVEELREVAYDQLTVRTVAKRAGVAPATAYTYFASKEHLVTEVFWRWLDALPPTEAAEDSLVARRVGDAMTDIALLVADEPELAAACTRSLLAAEPEVRLLRDRIGAAMRDRLSAALGDSADPVVLRTLELSLAGALVQAGMGHLAYADLPAQLREIAALVVAGERGDPSTGPDGGRS